MKHAAADTATIGDLRATIRLLQRRLNVIEHLCDETTTGLARVDLIRAALHTENP